MDMNTPAAQQLAVSTHQQIIETHAAQWLKTAPRDAHLRLRNVRNQAKNLPWLASARNQMPNLVEQLQALYAEHLQCQERIAPCLDALATLDDFAAPLLSEAIKARYGLDLDVRSTHLFHASHAQTDSSFAGASKDPMVEANTALRAATRPLLTAALQNFTVEETQPGAMDKDGKLKAEVFQSYQVSGPYIRGTALNIAPHEFAALARQLDLGGRYQAHIDSLLDAQAAVDLQAFDRSTLMLEVHLARLKEQIDQATYDALFQALQGHPDASLDGQRLYCSALRLWDVELTGILVIGKDREKSTTIEPVVIYMPGDPVAPIKRYASAQAFHDALRDRLFSPGFPAFFSRFIPARHRSRLMDKLNAHLYPTVKKGRWFERRWLEQEADRNARLRLDEARLPAPLFEARYRRKLALIKDDARFQGVSTAEQNERSHEQRLIWWRDAVLNALNVAAFAVPVLGEVMLAVTAAQLGYEVYEGIESWEHGEREQALGYLFDVLENVALMAALGAAVSHTVPMAAIEAPPAVERLKPVQRSNGKTGLWKPDLTPFAHDVLLPADATPDAMGLYHYQGKQWLSLEGRVYSAKATGDGRFVMESKDHGQGFEPPLRHNGVGAWLHVLDEPGQMQRLELLRRMGYNAAKVPDDMAATLLTTSGISDAALRKALTDLERPPALLADTVLRYTLDSELGRSGQREHFDLLYQSLQTSHQPGVEQLQKLLPVRLPRLVAEELLNHATPAERKRLTTRSSLPSRLADEARHYSQQVRLSRAYEGLYLASVSNPDTDVVILHSLQGLPGWSADVRLEVRDEHFSGPLLDSIGHEDAPIRKVLIKDQGRYMARDAQDQHLNGLADLYASILHALPDAQRKALGLPHTGQGADLQRAIQAQPGQRHVLREALGMSAVRPAFRSPMRLADGRLGYPLSGRAGSMWTVTRESLINKLTLLELEQDWPQDILERLLASGMSFEAIDARLDTLLVERNALTASLTNWEAAPAAASGLQEGLGERRLRISNAIWRQWSFNSLPEAGHHGQPLSLFDIALEDFPAQLPDFFHDRVTRLHLDNLRSSPVALPNLMPMIYRQTLDSFLSRFANVQSLQLIQNGPPNSLISHEPGLLGRLANALPQLTDLAVINQQLWLDQAEMDGLQSLANLNSLDLSGNRFSQQSTLQLDWLRPHRLVLAHTDLRHWPSWLDTRVPGPIRELSLANNRMTELPSYILDNPYSPGNQSQVDMRGNPLSVGSILRARLDEGLPDRSLRFLVDTPPAMQVNLDLLNSERAALTEAIDGWNQASTSQAPLSEQALLNRQRIGQALMEHWRAYARGETQTPLFLDEIDLADFPRRLPNFIYLRVRSLRLNQVSATGEQLDNLLKSFTHLTTFRASGATVALQQPPSALLDLPRLTSLSLTNMGLVIDQNWAQLFGRLPKLEQLELDGNPLGNTPEVASLGSLNLRWLSLRNTGLNTWPAWVLDLLPAPLETLILDNNQLTDIPEELLANPRRQWGHSEISLRGNPLAHHVMLQAHTSQHYGRSFSFEMDLPQDIREATWYESHDSDSTLDDSDVNYHVHSPTTSSSAEESNVDPWMVENDVNAPDRATTWQLLREEDDAHNLLDLVGYLQRSADYRNASSRPQLIERVWQVLNAAAQDAELRVTLDGIAEEPLHLIRNEHTCPDGVMLEFNQMEVMVFTRQSLQNVQPQDRRSALFSLTRRMYRLHELDRIAREQANGRDEAEVRMAYRLHWSEVLELPVPPVRMLYEAHARIQPGELDAALVRVQAGEQGDSFLDFAITQAHWASYLREENSAGFERLKRTYHDNLNRLSERYDQQGLSMSSPEFEAEARRLEQEYEEDQLTLLRALTTEVAIG